MKALIIFFIFLNGTFCYNIYRDEVFPINRPRRPRWKKGMKGPTSRLPPGFTLAPSEAPKVFTTPEQEFRTERTVIIQGQDLKDVLNIDKGRYDQVSFDYTNYQDNLFREPKNAAGILFCLEQMMKCQATQPRATRMCGYNRAEMDDDREYGYVGYMTASYCEIHFDNCRRGFRAWRVLSVGDCRFWYGDGRDNIYIPLRRNVDKSLLLSKIKEGVTQASIKTE